MTPGDWAAILFFVAGLVARHVTSGVDADEASRYIRWYRRLSNQKQGAIDGVLLAIGTLWTKYYVDVVFLKYFGGGGVELAIGIVLNLVGTGLGFSAGKALTEQDYSMFSQPDTRGQAAVDPMFPSLLIAGIVASLVIAKFLKVWPAELTRASETVVTPCYYFCGPWYTWLPVIFIITAVVGVVSGYVYGELKESDDDGSA